VNKTTSWQARHRQVWPPATLVGLHTQEVLLMLAVTKPPRKRSARQPFLAPLWGDDHPAFRRIDATLPADHHARWLVRVVAHLDLTALRLSYAGYGSLAYPVELLVAFLLFVYSQGILSPAQWARQARYDDQCKWLLRGLQPSRSRLYSFRDRLEPFLDAWHRQLIAWALLEGITTARSGSLDGTFTAALASRHQLLTGRRLDRRLLLLRLLVWLDDHGQGNTAARLHELPELLLLCLLGWLALLELGVQECDLVQTLLYLLVLLELLQPAEGVPWSGRLPAWVPASVAGRQRVLTRYEQAQHRLTLKMQPYLRKKKLSAKDEHTLQRMKVSVSDPEAALGYDKAGTYRPLYNVPLVQATDAPLTLAWDVLSRNNDDGLLKPMMEKTCAQLGQHLQDVRVDGAFLSVGEVAWCEKAGITVYGPPSKPQTAKAEGANSAQHRAEPHKPSEPAGPNGQADAQKGSKPPGANEAAKKQPKYAKEAFRYDSEAKVYYCPQGKRLPEVSHTTLKRQNGIALPMIVHQASGQDCQQCAVQQHCTSNPAKGRVVKRYQGEEALERLEQRMAQPASKQAYKLRKQSVELAYADLKEHRGLRIFRCFGQKRARTQAGLVILASNGLHICAALQRRDRAAQTHAPPAKQPA
jgi:transposase